MPRGPARSSGTAEPVSAADPVGAADPSLVADPFGTAELRRRVLDAWADSPARFREDANAEEDLALGGYRDRVVVELAQNAADAAARAGVPGRLLLSLSDGVLLAANSGAPLDAGGVESLSTLRASSKRDTDSVGRFGVGFAAVLAVSEAPRISSPTGGVRWSRESALGQARGLPALQEELARSAGAVPVLRLPFPSDVEVPAGYDTAVVLPLRSDRVELVGRLLDEVNATLLLALPGLREIVVRTGRGERVLSSSASDREVVTAVDGVETTWRVVRREAPVAPEILTDRPTEERGRAAVSVMWALPFDPVDLPGVVLAPTPTDEPLGLPAVLVASLPLEPTRRRSVPGPLRAAVTRLAGKAYAELLACVPAAALDLLPSPAAVGEVDGEIRAAAYAVLPTTAFVPAAAGGVLEPERTVLVDDADPGLLVELSEVIDGVAAAQAVRRAALLERLGARRLRLVDAVDLLAGRHRTTAQWHRLYGALSAAPVDALGALPVPLADGRVVRGARGTVLAGEVAEGVLAALAVLGVRVVDPGAEHGLLLRLGAVRADVATLLAGPEVEAALASLEDAEDDEAAAVGQAVLALVSAEPSAAQGLPLAQQLLLPDDEGELAPAGELLLPDSALAQVVDPDAFGRVEPGQVDRWGRDTLVSVGVLDAFRRGVLPDLVLDAGSVGDHGLADLEDWVDSVSAGSPGDLPGLVPECPVIWDLDAVDEGSWRTALPMLARPGLRAAVVDPVTVLPGAGGSSQLASYSAWWLQRHARLDGLRFGSFYVGDDPVLAALLEPFDVDVDDEFAAAVGVRRSAGELLADPDGLQEVLDRLGDPALPMTRSVLRTVYTALAGLPGLPAGVQLPSGVRVVDGPDSSRVVDADRAAVLDAPDLLPLLRDLGLVVVSRNDVDAVARLLQLPWASEEMDLTAPVGGVRQPVPDSVRVLLPDAPAVWWEHGELAGGSIGGPGLEWRVVDGKVHASTLDGLARGVAWVAGAWERRGVVADLLLRADSTLDVLCEAGLDD